MYYCTNSLCPSLEHLFPPRCRVDCLADRPPPQQILLPVLFFAACRCSGFLCLSPLSLCVIRTHTQPRPNRIYREYFSTPCTHAFPYPQSTPPQDGTPVAHDRSNCYEYGRRPCSKTIPAAASTSTRNEIIGPPPTIVRRVTHIQHNIASCTSRPSAKCRSLHLMQ